MRQVFLITLLFIVVVLSSEDKINKWKVTTTDEDGEKDFHIFKGQYKRIKMVLTQMTIGYEYEHKLQFVLTKESQEIFELLNPIEFLPAKHLEAFAYIGIKCTKDLKETDIVLHWEAKEESLNEYEYINSNITIDTHKPLISLKPTSEAIPLNSIGYVQLSTEIYNIEDVIVSFGNQSSLVIPRYLPQMSRKIIDISFISEEETNEVSFALINDCYELSPMTPSVKIISINPAEINGNTKKILIDSLKIKETSKENSIMLTMTIPIAPLILSCVAIANNKEVSDMEIRQQAFTQDERLFYTQYHINQYQASFTVEFTNLNRFWEYSVKCLLDNTASLSKDKQSTSISIGRDDSFDINTPLYASYLNKNPAKCATWTFDSNISILDPFASNAVEFCNELYSDEECIECSRKLLKNEPKKISICMNSKPICISKSLQESPLKDFENDFVKELQTGRKIKSKLNLKDYYSVSKVEIEIDDQAPDQEKIQSRIVSKDLRSVTFAIVSHNKNEIECFYSPLKLNTLTYMSPIEQIKLKEILAPKVEKIIIVPYAEDITPPEQHDEMFFNLIFNCKYLPHFKGTFYQTGPFPVATFINSDIIDEDDIPAKKVNCVKKPNLIECKQKNKKTKHGLITHSPKLNHDDLVENFSRLNNVDQKIILHKEMKKLKQMSNDKDKVNQVIKIAELLSHRICTKFNNYTKCRQSKQHVYSEIIRLLKVKFPFETCDGFLEELNNFGYNDLEENTKMLLILLESYTDNSDALSSKEDSVYLSNITSCITNSFKDIINQLSSVPQKQLDLIKKDIMELLIKVTTNFIDILKYDEYDHYFNNNLSNRKELIINPTTKTVKTSIEQAIDRLIQSGETYFEYDKSITLRVIPRKSTLLSSSSSIIDFNEHGIKIEINLQYLFDKFDGDKLVMFIYENYPLLSVRNSKINQKVIAIKLLDKNNKEVKVERIENPYQPKILFKKNKNTKAQKCYYYDEDNEDLSTNGITASIEQEDGVEYLSCQVEHFTDYAKDDDLSLSKAVSGIWQFIGPAVGAFGGLAFIIFLVCCCCSK